jgi:hypothetical protein
MSGRSGPFWDGVEGRVVHRDGDLAFLEASLVGPDAAVIATATATARVIALRHARAAA